MLIKQIIQGYLYPSIYFLQKIKKYVLSNQMTELPKIPAEAKEIIKHKRTGKIYASKDDFDADVADPNTDTTNDDFRQDLEIKVTRVSMGAKTKE